MITGGRSSTGLEDGIKTFYHKATSRRGSSMKGLHHE